MSTPPTKRSLSACMLGALACALWSCGGDTLARTQVMVLVDAEMQARLRTVDIDLEVRTGEGPIASWDVRSQRTLTPGTRAIDWPLEVALIPKDRDADRVYLVSATARDADGAAIAEVRAISGYQAGKTLQLLLLFEDGCLETSLSCSDTQTCRSGACVDAKVGAGDLDPYRPGARDRDGGGMADAGSADAATDGGPGQDSDAHVSCNGDEECDDEDPCTGRERCEAGLCQAGTPFSCEDSGDVCRPNLCRSDEDGEPTCAPADVEDGTACRSGDVSDQPESSCARDYECMAGACEPQIVDTCAATLCGAPIGCDAELGCTYDLEPDDTVCDDGDLCTEGDHCSGTDMQCVGTPKSCDDGVACTVDACDGAGACTNTPDDGACTDGCKSGTCDATSDCLNVTFAQDFTDCDDGSSTTTPDLCYRGECLGGRQGAPSASCELGDCQCSGFGQVRDLDYNASTTSFVGLVEASQDGGGGACTTGTVSIVYDVTLDALTPYSSPDTAYGAINEGGGRLRLPFAVTNTHIGSVSAATEDVDWIGTTQGAALAAQVPLLATYRGVATHSTGSFATTSNTYFWAYGRDSMSSTTDRLVRCRSCSTNIVNGCDIASITCSYVTSSASSSFVGVEAYTASGLNNPYGGVLAAVNYTSGAVRKRIFEDGAGKDMVPSTAEADDSDGAWSGLLRLSGSGQVLAYGSGSNNLRLCSDLSNTGDSTCSVITGVPNQAVRVYTRADTNSSAVAMLASSGTNHYLALLPAGLAPNTGANWRELVLSTSGSTTANAVAISPTSFMVLGRSGSAPYVWYWGPP